EPGGVGCAIHSLHVTIGLGGDNYGGSAGALNLGSEFPNPALATLSALRFFVAPTVWTNFTSPTTRLQFKTTQALADIQVNTPYKYTISIYNSANWGTLGGDGFYQPGTTVSTTVVVENPDASATVYNHLRITRTHDGETTVTDYTYTSST